MSRYVIEHILSSGRRISIPIPDGFLDQIRREAVAEVIRGIEEMSLSPNEEDGVAAVLDLLRGDG